MAKYRNVYKSRLISLYEVKIKMEVVDVREDVRIDEGGLINLTPHEITIVRDGKVLKKIPPSGLIARVTVEQEKVGEINGIPIVRSSFGDVVVVDEKGEELDFNMYPLTNKCNNCKDQGLCDVPARYHTVLDCEFQRPRKYFIVSTIVAQALAKDHRNDILAPDTSPSGVVRDEQGRIIGVKRFQRW